MIGGVNVSGISKRDAFENPSFFSFLGRLASPLSSRKVRVAIAASIGAVAADWGLGVSHETVLAIVGLGASLILAIAHEDAGRNAASRLNPPGSDGAVPADAA
jgi:hypothetical protein